MENKELNVNSEFMKKVILGQIKKLILAIRIEKKCSEDDANKDGIYFLQQLITILIGEKEKSNLERDSDALKLEEHK